MKIRPLIIRIAFWLIIGVTAIGAIISVNLLSINYSFAGGDFGRYQLRVLSVDEFRMIVQIQNNRSHGIACQITSSGGEYYFFEVKKNKDSRAYAIRLPVDWINFGCKH